MTESNNLQIKIQNLVWQDIRLVLFCCAATLLPSLLLYFLIHLWEEVKILSNYWFPGIRNKALSSIDFMWSSNSYFDCTLWCIEIHNTDHWFSNIMFKLRIMSSILLHKNHKNGHSGWNQKLTPMSHFQ